MIAYVLELVLMTGLIGPVVIATAYILWRVGVHDPFILTAATLFGGIPLGYVLQRWIGEAVARRRRARKGGSGE